jgi:hypothetical protein
MADNHFPHTICLVRLKIYRHCLLCKPLYLTFGKPLQLLNHNFLEIFFQAEQQRRLEIQTLLDEVAQIDAEIDEKVLDLYGITEPSDRDRILGNNVNLEEEPENIDDNLTSIEIET